MERLLQIDPRLPIMSCGLADPGCIPRLLYLTPRGKVIRTQLVHNNYTTISQYVTINWRLNKHFAQPIILSPDAEYPHKGFSLVESDGEHVIVLFGGFGNPSRLSSSRLD